MALAVFCQPRRGQFGHTCCGDGDAREWPFGQGVAVGAKDVGQMSGDIAYSPGANRGSVRVGDASHQPDELRHHLAQRGPSLRQGVRPTRARLSARRPSPVHVGHDHLQCWYLIYSSMYEAVK